MLFFFKELKNQSQTLFKKYFKNKVVFEYF